MVRLQYLVRVLCPFYLVYYVTTIIMFNDGFIGCARIRSYLLDQRVMLYTKLTWVQRQAVRTGNRCKRPLAVFLITVTRPRLIVFNSIDG